MLAQPSEVLVTSEDHGNAGGNINWAAGWTSPPAGIVSGANQISGMAAQVVNSPASVAATGTLSGSVSWAVMLVSLKLAPILPPAPTVPFFAAGYKPVMADLFGWWYLNAVFFQYKVVFRARQLRTTTTIVNDGNAHVIGYDTVDEDLWSGWSSGSH